MRAKSSGDLKGDGISDGVVLPPEIAFLLDYGAPREVLRDAAALAAVAGVSADLALIASGRVSEENFYRCLADKLGLRYYAGVPSLAADFEFSAAIRTGLAPLASNALRLRAVVAPSGRALGLLLAAQAKGCPLRDVTICAPARLANLIRTKFADRIASQSANALGASDRSLSARTRLTVGQTICTSAFLSSLAALALISPEASRVAISVLLLPLFTGAIWLRSIALVAGRLPREIAPLPDSQLPRYTIVAALRKEAGVVPNLMRAFESFDYPRSKLDIKFVIEADDVETREAVEALRPHAPYRLILAPPGTPMTKPRALNVALLEARGELLTVFDAEDTPAPDQLRRAAERFADDPEVDCLQARLAIDNSGDSWLSASFALEYATLFDFVNPGLAALELPIALGGTSNHFRTRTLRRVGGWDSWNVTEDADLGIRLARFGARVAILDSETFEEAPNRLHNWFRQRVRWQKGWLQTLVTHTRQPVRVIRELGPARALAAFLTIAGTVLAGLFGAPLFLEVLAREFFIRAAPGPIARVTDVATYVLVLWGAQNVVVPAIVALRRRRIPGAYKALAMTPIYYSLIFMASWIALFEWFARPFHWGKTEHGLRKRGATLNATSRASAPRGPLSARPPPLVSALPVAPARRHDQSA